MIETKKAKTYFLKLVGDIGAEGEFKAVFSTMGVKDKDGDITLPGAFGQQDVIIASYNHGSWGSGTNALPSGKGKIYEQGNEAIVEGKFFLDTYAGSETYKTVKNVGDLQEWSYSLPEIDFEIRMENGERTRVLKKIGVNEVAPVLMGAGTNTRLLDIKSTDSMPIVEHFDSVQAQVEGLVKRITNLGELREKDGRHPSEETMKRAAQFKATLSNLSRELEETQEKHDAVYQEAARFEKIIANRRAS